MTLGWLEVLVEEPSMEVALRVLLPRIVPNVAFQIYPHPGKEALISRLRDRLRGYSSFLAADSRILIVVDRDAEDCRALKRRIEQLVEQAELRPRSRGDGGAFHVLTRIVCEELEAWYFGDWDAVTAAYPRARRPARYHDPDAIPGGTWEAFERVMRKAGYFSGGLRKIEAASRIARHMDPARNTSRSFQVLRDGLSELASR
jgi:hypothetical protein